MRGVCPLCRNGWRGERVWTGDDQDGLWGVRKEQPAHQSERRGTEDRSEPLGRVRMQARTDHGVPPHRILVASRSDLPIARHLLSYICACAFLISAVAAWCLTTNLCGSTFGGLLGSDLSCVSSNQCSLSEFEAV